MAHTALLLFAICLFLLILSAVLFEFDSPDNDQLFRLACINISGAGALALVLLIYALLTFWR